MAEYTSRHTGLQIDEALDSALNVKQVRGIVKMTATGPVAAVPGEDFPADSGSTVSVTGLLKGVRNAETNEIEIQQAAAGTDYQTPLTAGADYATPSAVANKQNKITAQGLLKGTGTSVVAAQAGTDYALPANSVTVTLTVAGWDVDALTQTVSVSGATDTNVKVVSPAPASVDEYAACGVKAAAEGVGTITFACTTAPENDLMVNVAILG